MAVSLTNLPLPWQADPSLIDFGGDMSGALGGPQQRFTRLGSRWAVKFSSLPSLAWNDAQAFLAARLAASAAGSTVIASWPQIPFAAAIGAPAVNGAAQGGDSLVVNGLTPGSTALISGLFFSLVTGGRNYLYQLATGATVDGNGNATLSVSPWIRTPTAGGEALNFLTPSIEGFIGPGVDWRIDMQAWVSLPAFTITEVQ